MLKNFIIHIKNVIFFKFIICCICLSTILWILQNFNREYKELITRYHNIEESLAKETVKLYSILQSEQKILETHAKYAKLLSISNRQSCLEHVKLITNIDNLSKKYNLNEPITILIKQSFSNDTKLQMKSKQNTVCIRNYDIYIRFATKDFAAFASLIKEIYSCMPQNSMVLSMEVKKEEVLEPKVIYKLSTERPPDMIFTKLRLRIREIAINKI